MATQSLTDAHLDALAERIVKGELSPRNCLREYGDMGLGDLEALLKRVSTAAEGAERRYSRLYDREVEIKTFVKALKED